MNITSGTGFLALLLNFNIYFELNAAKKDQFQYNICYYYSCKTVNFILLDKMVPLRQLKFYKE